eukprot:3679956-Rhodomonas_salina.1
MLPSKSLSCMDSHTNRCRAWIRTPIDCGAFEDLPCHSCIFALVAFVVLFRDDLFELRTTLHSAKT